MADYRIYFLDEVGHIAFADWFAADSDEEAIKTVRDNAHSPRRCEIWQERRLVATLKAEGGPE